MKSPKPFKIKLTASVHNAAEQYTDTCNCLIATAIRKQLRRKITSLSVNAESVRLNGTVFIPDTFIHSNALGNNLNGSIPGKFKHYTGVALGKTITFTPAQ